MVIPYSDMACDTNYFKTKWLDNKTEYWALKNVSLEYIKERVQVATWNYFSGDQMEKYVHDITQKPTNKKRNDYDKHTWENGSFQC